MFLGRDPDTALCVLGLIIHPCFNDPTFPRVLATPFGFCASGEVTVRFDVSGILETWNFSWERLRDAQN
jgi:hypothetical protein